MTNFNNSVEKELLKSLYNDYSIVLQKKQSIIQNINLLSASNLISIDLSSLLRTPNSNSLKLNELPMSELLFITKKIIDSLDSK